MSKDSFLYQWHNIILENNQRNYHNNEWSSNLQCPSSGITSASVGRAIRSSSFSPRNRFKAVRLDCWMILFPLVFSSKSPVSLCSKGLIGSFLLSKMQLMPLLSLSISAAWYSNIYMNLHFNRHCEFVIFNNVLLILSNMPIFIALAL